MRRQRTPLRQRRRAVADQHLMEAALSDVWTTPGVRVMTIDPSLTRTGVAIWDAGETHPIDLVALTGRRGDDAVRRIDQIVAGIEGFITLWRVCSAVIEISSGRPGKGSEGGATGHLALYGMAVGEIRRACLVRLGPARVVEVDERTWTAGRKLPARAALARMVAPALAAMKDPGGDIGEAVALGHWWQGQVQVQYLRALAAAIQPIDSGTNSHDAGAARKRRRKAVR